MNPFFLYTGSNESNTVDAATPSQNENNPTREGKKEKERVDSEKLV